MQVVSHLATGTIREQLQDCFLIDQPLRLAIVADGNGPNGLIAARSAAEQLTNRIREIAPVTSADESEYRINEALQLVRESTPEPQSKVDLAVVYINRGTITAAASGNCAVLIQKSRNESCSLVTSRSESLPVQENQRIILCSEGLGKLLNHEAINVTLNTPGQAGTNLIEALASKSDAIYDGDDRCILIIDTDLSDLKAGEPKELELFENYNREFTFPLWAPLAIGASLSAAALLVSRKLNRWWKR